MSLIRKDSKFDLDKQKPLNMNLPLDQLIRTLVDRVNTYEAFMIANAECDENSKLVGQAKEAYN